MSDETEMKPLDDSPGLFQKCKNQVKKRLGEEGISPATLMIIVRYAMEVVELTKLKGRDQKDMAIKLVRAIVADSNLDETKKNICIHMLDEGVVERTIDLIIDATKGRIAVNSEEIMEVASSCCAAFLTKK